MTLKEDKKDIMLKDAVVYYFLSYIFPRTSAFSVVDSLQFVGCKEFLTAEGAK